MISKKLITLNLVLEADFLLIEHAVTSTDPNDLCYSTGHLNSWLTGCSTRPRSEQSLVRWATPQLHDIDALARMVDPALKGIYPAKSLSRLADIVALCVQPEPEFRPPMSEVVQALVRLMQRASLSKRRSDSASGLEPNDPSESSL